MRQKSYHMTHMPKKHVLGNYEREDRPRREFNDDKQQIFVGGLPITMSEQDIRDVFR